MTKTLRLICPICMNEVASGPAAEIHELTLGLMREAGKTLGEFTEEEAIQCADGLMHLRYCPTGKV